MRLVGDSLWVVQGPFGTGWEIKGWLGGGRAAILSYGVYCLVESRLIDLAPFPPYLHQEIILLGIFLGVGASYVSVRGELRRLW